MSVKRNSGWWNSLTDTEIQEVEKKANPFGISFSPPTSWPEAIIEEALTKVFYKEEPEGLAPSPLPRLAINYLTEKLNIILEKRREVHMQTKTRPQLAAWISQEYPGGGAWTHVDVVAHSGGEKLTTEGSQNTGKVGSEARVAGGPPFPKSGWELKGSYKSDGTTLPFASKSGGSSSGTRAETDIRPMSVNSSINEPIKGESESGHSSKKGRITRTSNRRVGPEPSSPNSPKRARGHHMCLQCHKTFPFPSKLKDHMHIHEEKKNHPCGVGSCTKAFKRRRELQAHKKTHTHGEEDEEMAEGGSPLPEHPEPPDSNVGHQKESPQDSKSLATLPSDRGTYAGKPSIPPCKNSCAHSARTSPAPQPISEHLPAPQDTQEPLPVVHDTLMPGKGPDQETPNDDKSDGGGSTSTMIGPHPSQDDHILKLAAGNLSTFAT